MEKVPSSKLQVTRGYIALISLLIIAAVGLVLSISISLRSIEELQMSFELNQSERAYNLANACLEEGLDKLRNNWANFNTNLSISGDSCIIDVVVSGATATLTAYGDVGAFRQKIEVVVDNNLEVTSWREY